MAYEKLVLLAPCHGLEDFPLYHTGEDAASLLACWTSLWHPLFLDSAKHLPHVERCDYPPENIANALLTLPIPCEGEMDGDLPEIAEKSNANLIRGQHQRDKIIQLATGRYGSASDQLDPDLVNDFLAFGFAFLQVQVLTQQMRYSSSIDETRIARVIKEAAAAAISGDPNTCREQLTVCHDALADERSHYYPVDVHLIDLMMLATADSTLGARLDVQLDDGIPRNILASGETIERLAQENPLALQKIRDRIDDGSIGLVGGEYRELPLPLMSFASLTRQLDRGRRAYEAHLGHSPTCFGRRRSGLYPSSSQVIRHAGFQSALHLQFDEGKTPEAVQGKTMWTMDQREILDCYARSPLDASVHETFLNLPSQLSDTMDTDHVATRLFVHWPGCASTWYDDLRRCARYGTALGQFTTVTEYFETAVSTARDSFSADDYSYPFLKQAAIRKEENPISKWSGYWRAIVEDVGRKGVNAIAACLGKGQTETDEATVDAADDFVVDAGRVETSKTDGFVDRLAASICAPHPTAKTVLNSFSFPRRILVSDEKGGVGESVYATGRQSDGSYLTLVDVPAIGFASPRFESVPPDQNVNLAEDLTLRNEFFTATIDRETGALRSLKDYRSRRNRLSQQLAFRITMPKTGQHWVDRQTPVAYSVMAADSIEITQNGPIFAELTSRGRMLALNGDAVGEFVQRYQVTRGSRVLVVDGEISTEPELFLDDAWDSYYACRFAFGDQTAILRSGARMQTHDVSRRRFEAPLFVDIDCGAVHTTVLTGGLSYHRRASLAQLDTLLGAVGETRHDFRIGIGVDLPSLVPSAIDFITTTSDPLILPGAMDAQLGWFIHIDAKNVVASWWEPLDGDAGLRVRLVETEARKSRVRVRAFRPWQAGYVVDARGHELSELSVIDGVAELTMEPHQFAELRLRW